MEISLPIWSFLLLCLSSWLIMIIYWYSFARKKNFVQRNMIGTKSCLCMKKDNLPSVTKTLPGNIVETTTCQCMDKQYLYFLFPLPWVRNKKCFTVSFFVVLVSALFQQYQKSSYLQGSNFWQKWCFSTPTNSYLEPLLHRNHKYLSWQHYLFTLKGDTYLS